MEFLSRLETEEVTRLIIVAPLGKDVWEACKVSLFMQRSVSVIKKCNSESAFLLTSLFL
jgi:hypothetical protein